MAGALVPVNGSRENAVENAMKLDAFHQADPGGRPTGTRPIFVNTFKRSVERGVFGIVTLGSNRSYIPAEFYMRKTNSAAQSDTDLTA
jgi:hypothetical protein